MAKTLPDIADLALLILMRRAMKKAVQTSIPITEEWLQEHIGAALDKRDYDISDGVFVVNANNAVIAQATNFGRLAYALSKYNMAELDALAIYAYQEEEVE